MHETRIVCGGLPGHPASALCLDVAAPKGSPERVNLALSQISRRMVAEIPDRLVDLLEIAAYVYAADQFVTRGGLAMRGMGREWRRRLGFIIPVRDLGFWKQPDVRRHLEDTLGFLSDDSYDFRFVPSQAGPTLQDYLQLDDPSGPPAGFEADGVALFSGGLDSLAGVAEAMIQREERLVLVSHHASPMIQSRQTELVHELRRRAPGRSFHVGITVTKGTEEAKGFTQRTRSFLFATLAFVVARLFGKTELSFFENGVVSLNLPVARHVLGSRATRTTHPRVLADFGTLFGMVADVPFEVKNPYFWRTKTEVLERIGDAGVTDLIARSFSCSHVRLSTRTGQQCGACSQCLDRRFAVLAAGLGEHDPGDGYRIPLLEGERKPGIETTMAEAFVLAAHRYATMTLPAFLGRYGEAHRALPHLGPDPRLNAVRMYDLHRRHGEAVVDVVNRALRTGASLGAILSAPSSSLLSLIQAPLVTNVVTRDVAEDVLPPAAAAARLNEPQPIARPISIEIGAEEGVLAGKIVVTGRSWACLHLFIEHHLRRLSRPGGQVPENLSADDLTDDLGIEEPTLRRRISRLKDEIRKEALEKLNAIIDDDDIVVNERGLGYHLNPFVVFPPARDESNSRAIATDVTQEFRASQSDASDG